MHIRKQTKEDAFLINTTKARPISYIINNEDSWKTGRISSARKINHKV